MKLILPLLFFLLSFFTGFSQNPNDTLKELNDLKNLKSQLLRKVNQLNKSNEELQAMIDLTKSKSDSTKAYIANHQLKITSKQEKYLKDADAELDKQSKRQIENKEKLKEASDLIKEIEARINELSKKSN